MKNRRIALIAVLLLSLLALPLAAQTVEGRIAVATPALLNGQPAEVKRQLTQALQEYREKKDAHGEAITLIYLGLAEMGLNNIQGARTNLEEAAKKMRAQEDAVGAWMSLLVLSQLETAVGRSTQALADIEEAFKVIDAAKTSTAPFTLKTFITFAEASGQLQPGMKEALVGGAELMKPMLLQYMLEPVTHDIYGSLLTDAGKLEKAEEELNAAVAGSQLFQGAYDFSIAAHFGDLRYRQQRYDEARTQYKKALSGGSLQMPMNPVGDQWIKVGIYDRLARLEAMTGHIDEAMRWSDKALEIARAAAVPQQVCVTLETRGQLLMRSERFGEAEGVFKEAMKIAETAKDGARQASIESSLGTLQMLSGNYGSAAAHLERSVHLYQSLSDPFSEAATWGSLSHAYLLTDNLAAAEDALAHARKLVDNGKFPFGDDMIALTETWLRLRKGQATTQDLKASLEKLKRNPQFPNEIGQEVERIILKTIKALEKGDLSGPGVRSGSAIVDAYNATNEGLEQIERGNPEEARQIWGDALEKTQSSDLRASLLGLIGGSYWKEGNFEQASDWFDKATKTLEAGGVGLSETMQQGYNHIFYHRGYYDILIESLLRSGKVEQAFDAAERARARAFLQLLGNHRLKPPAGASSNLAEKAETLRRKIANWNKEPQPDKSLEDLRSEYEVLLVRVQATSPEYTSMTRVEPLKLDSVRKELPRNTTLISYFVTMFGVHAWILDAETLEHVPLTVNATQLQRITCWADQLGRTRATEQLGGPLDCRTNTAKPEEAYAALFAPLRSKIHHQRLMIIPHGELHYVPFAALYDPEGKKYLVQDFTITYAPSASTLRFLRGKESPVDGGALVLGDPETQTLSPLPGAREEAESLAKRLNTTAKLGTDAIEDVLYHLGGRVDLVHIAAHASYDATNPLFSAIYLAEGCGRNGQLNVEEIQSELDLEGVNLVVLSACRSGVGKRSGGDEIVGLTRSILYAGSPGVLSTLWNISDEATTPLIEKFYDHLLTGPEPEASAADALRDAQIDLLRDPEYADPRYWAAFVLTGDPTGSWKKKGSS